MNRKTFALLSLVVLTLGALSAVSCSDGGQGKGSPTEPPAPSLTMTTQSGGSAGGSVRSFKSFSSSGGVSLAGVTVRVQGTSIATETNGKGKFRLEEVPTGNLVLLFERDGQSAPLPINDVKNNEHIELTVSVAGDQVTVEQMTRSQSPTVQALSVEMQPDTWNTNWANSSGTVSAFVRGQGFELIDIGSIQLVGPGGVAMPSNVSVGGNHVRARFLKTEAIAILGLVQAGDIVEVTVEIMAGSDPMSLPASVRVVGGDTASIDIQKLTNGKNADSAPGPSIAPGDPVVWTYEVMNKGDVELVNVMVEDNLEGTADCGLQTSLIPGASMTCQLTGFAVLGQYSNTATVTADSVVDLSQVTDSDPSHYLGDDTVVVGDAPCGTGYWKNHPEDWVGYLPTDTLDNYFLFPADLIALGPTTLEDALRFGGGSGALGGAKILLRHAVAALLNAEHPSLTYPRTSADVIGVVDAALASLDKSTMTALANEFEADNDMGCALD